GVVGDHGAELIAAVGQPAQAAAGQVGPAGAVRSQLITYELQAVRHGVGPQPEVEGAVRGDRRRRVGVAAIGQVGECQGAGGRRRVLGSPLFPYTTLFRSGVVGDHGAELIAAVGQPAQAAAGQVGPAGAV